MAIGGEMDCNGNFSEYSAGGEEGSMRWELFLKSEFNGKVGGTMESKCGAGSW